MARLGWFSAPEHTVHTFDRLVSTSADGRAIYGCTWKGGRVCGATEIRALGSPSPFAIQHREKQRAKRRSA